MQTSFLMVLAKSTGSVRGLACKGPPVRMVKPCRIARNGRSGPKSKEGKGPELAEWNRAMEGLN